jgi:hypothetical protein
MNKSKSPPFGKQLHQRLISGNTPDPFKVYPLFFYTCPEVHVFIGDDKGWRHAKNLNNLGYLVLVAPEDESPEQYKFPVSSCFVFVHLSSLNNEVSTLLGVIVADGAIGYQIILHSIDQNTPTNQIMDIFGEPCQRSKAVLYPEYYSRNKK